MSNTEDAITIAAWERRLTTLSEDSLQTERDPKGRLICQHWKAHGCFRAPCPLSHKAPGGMSDGKGDFNTLICPFWRRGECQYRNGAGTGKGLRCRKFHREAGTKKESLSWERIIARREKTLTNNDQRRSMRGRSGKGSKAKGGKAKGRSVKETVVRWSGVGGPSHVKAKRERDA